MGRAAVLVWVIALCACGAPAPAPEPTASLVAPINDPTGIAFDNAGALWVANYRGDSVLMFTRDQLARGGRVSATLAIAGGATGIRGPNRLAFDRSGRLWVANYDANSIIAFDGAALARGGNVAPEVTLRSEGIDQPTGIAFDPAGELWVTNQRNGSILAFAAQDLTRTGTPQPRVAMTLPGGKTSIPEAIAFEAEGVMWVAAYGSNAVVGFEPNALTSSGSPPPFAQFAADGPIGLAFDPGGRLWVTEATAVRALDPRPPVTALVTVRWDAMPLPHTPTLNSAGDLWFSCQNDTLVRVAAARLAAAQVRAPSTVISSAR